MKQKKYWEILLEKQREKGKDGLSIPFIIGSQNYLPKNSYKQNISELINDIVSSDLFEICIRFCMGTCTFIAEIRKEKMFAIFQKSKILNKKNYLLEYIIKMILEKV